MGKRTWLVSLRSVKISVFALAVLGVSLVSSLGYSRPASAESLLGKTLECVVTLFIPQSCRPAAAPSNSPAPAPTPAAEPSPAATGNASESANGSVAPPPASTSTAPTTQGVEYTAPPELKQAEELQAIEKAPELPAAVHHRSFNYEPMAYLAYMYGVKGASTTAAASENEVIESTANGWHILGIAWYWWLVGSAVVAGGVAWLRKANYKRDLSIVKEG